jgi:ABC-type sugar transport system substrate-binding protein
MKDKVDPVVDEAIETLNMKDGPARRKLIKGAGLFSATAAASALISACSSSSNSNASATKDTVGNFPKTPKWQFWFVNHVTTNPFFTPTQYGLADAAALFGLPTPKWGGSETSDIVIFIATPGTGNIQPRYDGAASVLKGKGFKIHEVATGAATSQEQPAEKAYLLGHKDTKGAFAVDAGSTEFLGTVLKSVGLKIPSGGFDTLGNTLSNIKSGLMDFTIYQNPYMQGFLPVMYMYMYNISGGTLQPADTDTGLTIIDKNNVAPFQAPSRYQGSTTAQKYIKRPSGAINAPMATTST